MNPFRQLTEAPKLAEMLTDDLAAPAILLNRAGGVIRAGAGYVALAGHTELALAPAVLARLRGALAAAEGFTAEAELLAAAGGIPVGLRLIITGLHTPAGILRVTDLRPLRTVQAQLSQAQALGDVGRLAGGIAHDFNNLLTAILGAAEDLAARPNPPAELDLIRGGAQRGADLVRQIMAFGQQQILRPLPVDVNAALRALQTLLTRLLGRGIDIALDLEEPGRIILMDPVEFDRVIVNLAVNARDAMTGTSGAGSGAGSGARSREGSGEASGRLTIAAARRLILAPVREGADTIPPGRYAVIELRDTGPGIPADILPHIFTPFFTTRRENGGNGLGLSTVHGIIRQSGGYLSVESRPGQGATFRITLPSQKAGPIAAPVAVLGPVPHAVINQAATQALVQLPDPHAAPTLLLVEDEAPVRLVAAGALRRAGWQVVESASAEAALDNLPPSLTCLVSDVVMPGLDGPGLVREIRHVYPGLPALLISGYADAAQRKALATKDIHFLAKPFSPRELVAAVAPFGPPAPAPTAAH